MNPYLHLDDATLGYAAKWVALSVQHNSCRKVVALIGFNVRVLS